MIGSTVVASGPRRCSRARTAVTMTAGQRSGSRRRHRTSSRRPMVSTDGLTRSNGSVSHAGKKATSPAGRNCSRSSASWPAIVPVGVTTTSGRRLERSASAAIEIGRATSTTASRAAGSPRARVSAGSSRSSGGSAARRTGPSRVPTASGARGRRCAIWARTSHRPSGRDVLGFENLRARMNA